MSGKEEYVFGSKVIDKVLSDEKFPIHWDNEDEKKLLWWYDDLHCPAPMSPMYWDFAPWWDAPLPMTRGCEYMFRRFWVPFGKEWPGKQVNGYCFTAVVPQDPEVGKKAGAYYNMVMPVYAGHFLEWWDNRLLPEVKRNLEYLDSFPYEKSSLPELMVLLEDTYDIFERHFRLHWILNLAQLQATLTFRGVYQEVFGKVDEDEVGKILTSTEDVNWESGQALWKMKELVKKSASLRKAFEEPKGKTGGAVLSDLERSSEGKTFLSDLKKYLDVYGHKCSPYTHELIYPTWIEKPAAAIQLVRSYVAMDYDYNKDVKRTKDTRDKAIEAMYSRVKKPEDKKRLESTLKLALDMTPLTPNHHFYFDQGTHARVRMVFLEIGKKLKQLGMINEPDDIFFLKYNELREIASNPKAFDAKAKIAERRKEWNEQLKLTPLDWIGTATQWAAYEEPYIVALWGFPDKLTRRQKVPKGAKEIKGLGAAPGVAEGPARVVKSQADFDSVQPGDILVCILTNPAWTQLFPNLKGVVTDAGGYAAHPAILSREFGIPCVTSTSVATQLIHSGDRLRVDGNTGTVEFLGK